MLVKGTCIVPFNPVTAFCIVLKEYKIIIIDINHTACGLITQYQWVCSKCFSMKSSVRPLISPYLLFTIHISLYILYSINIIIMLKIIDVCLIIDENISLNHELLYLRTILCLLTTLSHCLLLLISSTYLFSAINMLPWLHHSDWSIDLSHIPPVYVRQMAFRSTGYCIAYNYENMIDRIAGFLNFVEQTC